MRKHVEESVATGVAAGRGRGGRFSAGRKREVVLRLLRGEDLESVSRAVGITAARASHWRASVSGCGAGGPKEPRTGCSGRRPSSAAGQDRRAADGDRVTVREGGPAGGRRPFGPAEVDAMSGAQSISTRRAYGDAAGLPRVAPRPLQCVCAAAGDTVSCAVSSPRADRRGPGRRPGGPHSPGARSLAVSWRGLPKSLGEAAGRGDARARPPSPAARGPRAWPKAHDGPSPPRRPT